MEKFIKDRGRLLPAVVGIVGAAFTAAGCGGSSGVKATLAVGQLQDAKIAASREFQGSGQDRSLLHNRSYSASDLTASANAFSYAHVDGLKISVKELSLSKGSDNQWTVADWTSSPRDIEIGNSASSVISISDTVTLPPADTYTNAQIRFKNSYKVKAYCLTANKFVYTSASGIQTLSSAPSSLPSDYDYYSYPFAYVTTAGSATDNSSSDYDAYEGNSGTYTVTADAGQQVAFLVDNSFLISCYDGTGTTTGSGALSPFTWTNNHGVAQSAFFSNSAPAFGMGYVPIFLWVGSSSASLPTADTYVIGSSSGAVTGSSINYAQVGIATAAFDSSGSLIALRGRIGGGSYVGMSQMFTQSSVSSGIYTFYNGDFWCSGANYTGCGLVKDKIFTGFTRAAISDFTTATDVTISDGPQCHNVSGYTDGISDALVDYNHPEWGTRNRDCAATSHTYWRKFPH